MSLAQWLLFLHVLSAFLVVGALTALWGLVLATRPGEPVLGERSAQAFGRVMGPLVGVGLLGTIVFGLWLAIDLGAYHPWDGWIVASLVLWALAGWAGGQAGREFQRDPVGRRVSGIRLQALNSLAIVAILVLMIWKPGA